jgi:hypothetical protein
MTKMIEITNSFHNINFLINIFKIVFTLLY